MKYYFKYYLKYYLKHYCNIWNIIWNISNIWNIWNYYFKNILTYVADIFCNIIIRSKCILAENNKIEVLFPYYTRTYFSKPIFKVIFIHKKQDKILKSINMQLKQNKPSQLKQNYLSIKQCLKMPNFNKAKYL